MSNNDDLRNRLRNSLDRGVAPELSSDLVSGAASRPAPHLASPARTLRIAGAAGVLVAAVTVGALVVAPSMNRAPLFTAAAASPESAALGASDAMSTDMKIGWWVEYHYTAGASLSTQGGSGPVYQLVLDTSDPEGRTAELAATLGVDGAVTPADYADPAYPTWVVGPQDGTAANLSFSAFGTGDWWFNDPTVTTVWVCDESVAAADAESYGCTMPADAPANMAPTGDEARSLAQQLFASTGFDANPADIEITSDLYGTSANVYFSADGVKTALSWSAYWTNTGGLSYAYGHSMRAEARGTFDTVSPTEAVQRLSDYRWYGSPGPEFQGGAMLFAEKSSVAIDPVDPTTEVPVDPGTEPGTETPVDPTTPAPEETLPPIEVEPTPEIVEVTVDNATATLLLMWDANGNAWLVPGYAIQMEEGWWNAVVSLVDGVIALPEQL